MSHLNRHSRTAALLAAALVAAAAPAAAQTPDSAFAVSSGGASLFRVNVDGGTTFGGTWDGDIPGTGVPAEGSGTRMMWYPRKAAFRAGGISGTQWDAANIGDYSVAIGQDVRASASNATAFGLRSTAAQQSSFAAGEDNTASGAASVALGYHAHTNARQGSFVFGDRSTLDTIRAGANHSASWRVTGGFRIYTNTALTTGVAIQSGGVTTGNSSGGVLCTPTSNTTAVIGTSTCAYLSTGGVWTNNSDVRQKHLFEDVPGEDVLTRLRAVPIRTWSYRVDADEIRHLGPMAQDFRRAFGLGNDSVSIGTIDADGVALSGVQALDTRTLAQAARIEAVERDNAALRAENAELRARLERIEQMLSAPGAPPAPAPRQ
jgi:hypothetical protein